ncbi:MAG TPA: hypothetical protein VMN60_04845 [Longimicrobiales bacterium]|nr:hypothetical protein [Longimicrobiales bacterium]
MILCVLLDEPPEGAVLEALLAAAPRVVIEPARVWLDVRGMAVDAVHARLRLELDTVGVTARCGAALRPVVAEVAAHAAAQHELVHVGAGSERDFLAQQPLARLGMDDPLLGWLADVGIVSCGELAAVAREAVEVRFGAAAVRWWRWSRGDDERRLFAPVPPEQPGAAVDFIDYVVTDPERLIFTTHALLGGLCEQLRARGAHARRLRLRLPLANGAVWERTLRTARPTADRAAWLRLARTLLERLTVPDAVSGVSVTVEATAAASAVQGDLFDAGFATATAVETAVARLIEDHGDVVREPVVSAHPLVEVRSTYRPLHVHEVMSTAYTATHGASSDTGGRNAAARRAATRRTDGTRATAALETVNDDVCAADPVGLTLQLLPEPRAVIVETALRRDHVLPTRYRDDKWHNLVHAAGPDRVSGGQWDATYAREYFRAVTSEGTLVWLFRDARKDEWFLHGWWD